MIIWLASYPRSGNTLLRTLLYQHFGLSSFADELGEAQIVGLTDRAKAMFGYKDMPHEWNKTYQQAHCSNNIHLIKTHRLSIDENKAIYVVRDGRNSYISYSKYHSSFIKQKPLSLLGLILGLDYYGGWSEHYQSWIQAKNPLLILRYEDLVSPSELTIEKLADFLGLIQPEGAWNNPFIELHKENPNFFRQACVHWQKPHEWNDLIDAIFFYLHGDLMIELGYVSAFEAKQAVERLPTEIAELLSVCKYLFNELSNYQKTCLERQAVIDGLKQACDERLALIEILNEKLMQM